MTNIQDHFLNSLCKDKVPVTIFLTNGFQIRGVVIGFDNYVVQLDVDGKQQLVFKHVISTIVPSQTMQLPEIE